MAALGAVSAAPAQAAVEPWQKGAVYTSWWHDEYLQPQSDAALEALAANGTTRVAILTTWYQDDASSTAIGPLAQKTPSDVALLHAMQTAKSLGMDVVLKPHVDVVDGTFRGTIAPSDRGAWFDSYRAMTNHYADLATQGGASMFIVGTELTTVSDSEAEWRHTIADVRARFGGSLTFAANFIDGARTVTFWDALDFIGVDAYMPVADAAGASVDALAAAWHDRGYVAQLADLNKRYGKPVIFTELGYQSRSDTAVTPWGGAHGAIDAQAQANAFAAAFRAFWDVPWFAGIYWWDWSASGSPGGNGSHWFARTPANDVLRDWYTRPRTGPASDAPPASTPAPVPPAASTPAPSPKPPTVKPRAVKLSLRYTRSRRLVGTVRQGASPCRTKVTIRLRNLTTKARGAARRTVTARSTSTGTFRLSVKRLPRGRYRAQAVVTDARCGGTAQSPKRSFRLR